MKKIGINFIEHTILFLTDGQQGTETALDQDLDQVRKYVPADAGTRTSLLWDFEKHTCTVCEDYVLPKSAREQGCILTKECFVERPDLTYPCNTDYGEFMEALGYYETDLAADINAVLASLGSL